LEFFEYFMPLDFRANGGFKNINLPGLSLTNVLLVPSEYGKSLYAHINTLNLLPNPAGGPAVRIPKGGPTPKGGPPDPPSDFDQRLLEPSVITDDVDAFCPAPGLPLEFRRTMPSYVDRFAYLGSFGRGWTHTYDIFLTQFQDGMICFHGGDGRGRYFTPVPGAAGTYSNLPGDYGVLTYNADGTFQLAEKNGLTYGFRNDLLLNYIADRNGNRITAVYNSVPQLVEVDHSSGNSLRLEYNADGRIVSLTDAAGWVTTYDYDGTNSILLLTKTSFIGAQTEYVYSVGQGEMLDYRLLSAAYPDGSHRHFGYDTNGHLTQVTGTWGTTPVSYAYDTTNAITAISNVSGQYDSNGVAGVTLVQVNAMGEPTWVEQPDGQQYSFIYDSSGNMTATVDPLSRVTSFAYDAKGNLLATTNAMSGVVRIAYESVLNNPTNVVNELGYPTSIIYDSSGNPTNVTFADGTTETLRYDSRGNPTVITDAAGKTTGYGYNAQGLRTSITNGLGAVTRFDYSTFG
jgi:YD repeat-containing protein